MEENHFLGEVLKDQGSKKLLNNEREGIEVPNEELIVKEHIIMEKPKNPITPYFAFIKEYRKISPELSLKDLANLWKDMTQSEKQVEYLLI